MKLALLLCCSALLQAAALIPVAPPAVIPAAFEPNRGRARAEMLFLNRTEGLAITASDARLCCVVFQVLDGEWPDGVTVQRQFTGNLVMEVGYMGNHAVRLNANHPLNWIPEQYLSRQPFRDQPVIDRLTANVANPFRNLLPGTSLNGTTIALSQFLFLKNPTSTGSAKLSMDQLAQTALTT